MTVYKIQPAGFAANCYLVTADGKNAIAIDPAQPSVAAAAQNHGLTVQAVLLTHGHFDHIGGCNVLQGKGAKIGCLAPERAVALGTDNLALWFTGEDVPPFTIDFVFNDGDSLNLCGLDIRVIATPGHTVGGACFLIGDHLFTGDTLFENSMGRTDFPTGDSAALYQSLKKLAALEGDYTVCTGHGEDTTLERERKYNPFLQL